MSYYSLDPLPNFYNKVLKFQYTSCAIFKDKIAFGTPAGSIHIYSINDPTSPNVLSFPTLMNKVKKISFSPRGGWLTIFDDKGIHFIEGPLTSASLFYSQKVKPGAKFTSVFWISEPPAKITRTPFAYIGDSLGTIYSVRHQNIIYIATLPTGIVQLSSYGDTLIAGTRKGSYIIPNITSPVISRISRKTPAGQYGILYSEKHNAICLSKPDAHLSLATPLGKIKATLNFMPQVPPLPDGISANLSLLSLINPFLISRGVGCATFIINLTEAKLEQVPLEITDVIDSSSDEDSLVFLCKNNVFLFKIIRSVKEYIHYLVSHQKFSEAQQIVISQHITDPTLISLVSGPKVSKEDSPKPTEPHLTEISQPVKIPNEEKSKDNVSEQEKSTSQNEPILNNENLILNNETLTSKKEEITPESQNFNKEIVQQNLETQQMKENEIDESNSLKEDKYIKEETVLIQKEESGNLITNKEQKVIDLESIDNTTKEEKLQNEKHDNTEENNRISDSIDLEKGEPTKANIIEKEDIIQLPAKKSRSLLDISVSDDFSQYVTKLELKKQPLPLSKVDPDLFEQLLKENPPARETMEKIEAAREFIIIDESVKPKINEYVISHPDEWVKWSEALDFDNIVAQLNDDESASKFVSEMASKGTSDLCKIIANIDSYSLEFCVANSPPIRPHNMKNRRASFEELFKKLDPFSPKIPSKIKMSVSASKFAFVELSESPYELALSKVNEETITPEETKKLLQLYEWESQIREHVKTLRKKLSDSLLYKEPKPIPPWILSCFDGDIPQTDQNLDSGRNWGCVPNLTICPACGMPLMSGENCGSIAVFSCRHSYHISCLHSRYCPTCYSSSLD